MECISKEVWPEGGVAYYKCYISHLSLGSINAPRSRGGARKGKKAEKYGNTWCVCNWLFSCFKKDEPQVGSTTFQSEVPPPPEVSGQAN